MKVVVTHLTVGRSAGNIMTGVITSKLVQAD